jgi:exopolysaccharide biosynthesis polyprenyl glycosylphosphotransferase
VASDTEARRSAARPRRLGRRRRGDIAGRPALPPYEAEISAIWEAIPGQGTRFASRRDTLLRRFLALGDACAGLLAVLISVIINDGRSVELRLWFVLLAPLIVVAAKAIGLYDRDQHVLRKTTIDEVPSILYLAILYALVVWLAEVVLFTGYLTRPSVYILVLTGFVLITAGRLIVRGIVAATAPPERCLVIGNGEDADRIAAKLSTAGVNAQVTGRVALDGREGLLRDGGRADAELLRHEIREQFVHRVIIAPDGHDQDEVLHLIRLIKALGVKVTVLPRLLEVVGSSSTYEDVDGMTLLGVRQFGATKSSEALKRTMDILGAGLTVFAISPLLAMLALAVKLDSRGPVFFRQRRIGRHGETFSMLKFRSMVPDAEQRKAELLADNEAEGGLFKIADDPRITRVGRFLRRTSLDELPQLFNVLGGSMSLVGPRPLVLDEDALIQGWQRRRLAVKPGMTGMWQIFGSSRIPMQEMVKIDYLYGANWSLWLDLKILLRTVPYVLRRRGL